MGKSGALLPNEPNGLKPHQDPNIETRNGEPAGVDKGPIPEILIWTNRGCSACVQAKQFFEREKLPYTERRSKADGKGHRAFALATGGAKTVPQIFIGERHVGGYDDLLQASKTGELDVMLGRTEAKETKGFLSRLSSRFQRG